MKPDLQERIEKWYEEHWGDHISCDICHGNEWSQGSKIVSPLCLDYEGQRMDLFIAEKNYFPCLIIVCDTCGNTKFLHLQAMGVANPPEEKKGEKIEG